MTIQYPEKPTILPQTDFCLVFSSSRSMNSERKGLRVGFASLEINYIPGIRVKETVGTAEELSQFWKPRPLDGAQLFVMSSISFNVYLFPFFVLSLSFARPIFFFSFWKKTFSFNTFEENECGGGLDNEPECKLSLPLAAESAAYLKTLYNFTVLWDIGPHLEQLLISRT